MSFLDYIKQKFDRVLICDTEYQPDITNTNPKNVLCYVYQDIFTKEIFRFWEYDKQRFGQSHFDLEETLIVSHYALAEAGSFLRSLLPVPINVWDTWLEAKTLYNGIRNNFSLLHVANEYNIDATMTEEEKEYERRLILDSKSFSLEDQTRILDYCQKDVETTGAVFLNQVRDFEEKFKLNNEEDYELRLNQICIRGAAQVDFAKINATGISVDLKSFSKFKANWPVARKQLIEDYNNELNCFDGEVFKAELFEDLLRRIDSKIYSTWPRTFTGKLSLTEATFKKFIHIPEIEKVFEVKNLLSKTTLGGFSISDNGRSITNLRPFSTSSYRCAPGGSTFPFNASAWLRNFIRPPWGFYNYYIDYRSQEPAIQGYLSGDEKLIDAYKSGDIYIFAAKQFGEIPKDYDVKKAKKDFLDIRNKWKIIFLATSYGMGREAVAAQLKTDTGQAAALLKKFKQLFHVYYDYINSRMNTLHRDLRIETVYGCSRHLSKYKRTTANSWRNYPIQANGAEILRAAIHALHKNNIKVCATIHDAVLIEVPIPEHKKQLQLARNLMTDAAIEIIGGRIETDYNFIDERGFIQSDKQQIIFNKLMTVVDSVTQPDTRSVAADSILNNII